MSWLVALGFLSLGASFGFLLGASVSRWDSMRAFGEGIAHGLDVAAAAAREAQDDLIGAEHRKAQINAAREGRQ